MGREVMRMGCPECGGGAVKDGIRNGGQAWRCRGCGRRFMGDPERRRLTREKVDMIKNLLAQGVTPSQIAPAAGISKRQIYSYKNVING